MPRKKHPTSNEMISKEGHDIINAIQDFGEYYLLFLKSPFTIESLNTLDEKWTKLLEMFYRFQDSNKEIFSKLFTLLESKIDLTFRIANIQNGKDLYTLNRDARWVTNNLIKTKLFVIKFLTDKKFDYFSSKEITSLAKELEKNMTPTTNPKSIQKEKNIFCIDNEFVDITDPRTKQERELEQMSMEYQRSLHTCYHMIGKLL